MNVEFYIPTGILKEFVDFIAFLSCDASGTGVAFPRMNQVIIINLGSNFWVSDIYAATPRPDECPSGVWMNGKYY